jgi:integrase
MPVFISDKHLKASDTRQTYSDNKQQGFVLRTTPNGVFSFYYTHLNKNKLHPKTKKPVRDWYLIGTPPEWNPVTARKEATRLAGLVVQNKSIKQIRQQKIEAARAGGVTFQQLHDEYIEYCKELVQRRWGVVPRKESWQNIEYMLGRALQSWKKRVAGEITSDETMELYKSYVAEGHPAMANCTRGDLRTMFNWGVAKKYVTVNPCLKLLEDDRAVERRDIEDGRVLTADEIRTFWFGVDDPNCPGERLSKLALKLSLVTVLRTGECVAIPRTGVASDTVTIPLSAVKSRRSKKARAVVQPLNSLARAILGEVFSIGDPNREFAFPLGVRSRKRERRHYHLEQNTLCDLLSRKTTDKSRRMGINEYLGLVDVTPHDLRRTGACILEQLGYDDGLIGKVMTHKATGKDTSPVTRAHYLVPVPIIARPVDPRIKALDDLDDALREILGLPRDGTNELPAPPRLLTAA